MGVIYSTPELIPAPGEHEAFASEVLDVLEGALYVNEGALIVGSFGNGAWNVRSDIDLFVHAQDGDRVESLKTMAVNLSHVSRVPLEFHCEAVPPERRSEGDYYNSVRVSPRYTRAGFKLGRGVDPNVAIGSRLMPTTPTSASAFFTHRLGRIREKLETGEQLGIVKEAQKGLELPGKIAVRAAALSCFGFDGDALDLTMEPSYQELLALDAGMTSATQLTQAARMSGVEYQRRVQAIVPAAAELGIVVLGMATERLADLTERSKGIVPIPVRTDIFQQSMQAVFESIHRRQD